MSLFCASTCPVYVLKKTTILVYPLREISLHSAETARYRCVGFQRAPSAQRSVWRRWGRRTRGWGTRGYRPTRGGGWGDHSYNRLSKIIAWSELFQGLSPENFQASAGTVSIKNFKYEVTKVFL